MSNTRTADHYDFRETPERNLSSPHLRPINISLLIASQAARIYDVRTRRACLWLANVAANSERIQLCWHMRGLRDPLGTVGRITEADLARQLELSPIEIYRALTGSEQADLPRFVAAVEKFRGVFEAQLPPLVKTRDSETIEAACEAALSHHGISVVRGKWRHGKTGEAERRWLLSLHNTIWLDCPSDNTERTFLLSAASALGISIGGGKKSCDLRQQVKKALSIGLIERVIIDEAHNLWPGDIASAKPLRAEYVRELRDTKGVAFVLLTTEQFALALEMAKVHNARWAPGQFFGRVNWFQLRDVHSDKEILEILRLHGGEVEEAALPALVAFAKAQEGYLGTAVVAVREARGKADLARGSGATITAAEIAQEMKKQQVDERVVQIAKHSRPDRHGRPRKVVLMERRAA